MSSLDLCVFNADYSILERCSYGHYNELKIKNFEFMANTLRNRFWSILLNRSETVGSWTFINDWQMTMGKWWLVNDGEQLTVSAIVVSNHTTQHNILELGRIVIKKNDLEIERNAIISVISAYFEIRLFV